MAIRVEKIKKIEKIMKKLLIISLILISLVLASCLNSLFKGSLSGNVYYKYNNYIGDKPDAGAEISLYSLDDKNVKFSAVADVRGDYNIDDIPVGNYFLIVRSETTTACPVNHLGLMKIYATDLKQVFNFDINKYDKSIYDIYVIDSLASISLDNNRLNDYYKNKEKANDKANELINTFPDDFIKSIKLYTGYSNAYDFEVIKIERNKNKNQITDFGITCI